MRGFLKALAYLSTILPASVLAVPIAQSDLSESNTVIDFRGLPLGAQANPLTIGRVTFSSSTAIGVQDISPFDADDNQPTLVSGNVLSTVTSANLDGVHVPMNIVFATAVSEVGFGWFDPNVVGNELRVYDAQDVLLEVVAPVLGPPGGTTAAFVGVRRPTAEIARLEVFTPDPDDIYAIDNFSFSGPVDVLLRRTSDERWLSYTISFDDVEITIHDRGAVDLTRNAAYETLSRSDFDGDGNRDILLRDTTGSENRRWLLGTLVGTNVTSDGFVDLSRNEDWQMAAAEDFDGDGKADVLLHNIVDGRWQMNLLDSQTVLSRAILPITGDLTDTLVGAEDFDADGVTDLLLRRADGSWLLYLMDGVNAPVETTPLMTTDTERTVQALADFNGDGSTDVLLRRPNGRWFFYLLDGDTILGSGPLPLKRSLDFSVVSSADFSGDGNADILLRRADSRWYLYTLDGLAILTEGWLTDMTRNLGYEIVADDDFSADGMADLLLRRTDGRWVLYSIDGTVPTVISKAAPRFTRNPDWVPVTIPPFPGLGTGYGMTFVETIDPPSELDVYEFIWAAGDEVLVRLTGLATLMDPTIRVLNPDNSPLCNGGRINAGTVELFCTVVTTGIHTIIINDDDGLNVGPYHLSLQRLNGPEKTVFIRSGETISDSIDPSGELDTYIFDVAAGDAAIVRVTGFATLMDPVFRVYRPDGSQPFDTGMQLCQRSRINAGTIEATCNIDITGIHSIIVSDDDGRNVGNYDINLLIL